MGMVEFSARKIISSASINFYYDSCYFLQVKGEKTRKCHYLLILNILLLLNVNLESF